MAQEQYCTHKERQSYTIPVDEGDSLPVTKPQLSREQPQLCNTIMYSKALTVRSA